MQRVGFRRSTAATLVAGNAGMGITFPFSASMFVLVGSTTVGPLLDINELVVPLLIGGLWCLLRRLIVTVVFFRKSGVSAVAPEDRLAVATAFRRGWATLLLFVAVAVPLVLTSGRVAAAVSGWTGVDVSETVSILFWIPVVLTMAGIALGLRRLPRSVSGWSALLANSAPRFGIRSEEHTSELQSRQYLV